MTDRQADVAAELKARRLQRIAVGDSTAPQLLARAERMVHAAGSVLDEDADAAYVLAYDAARFAGTAVLAVHGVRPTARGGHAVVEAVLDRWYGDRFDSFGPMRRRRNELEYPRDHVEETTREEAAAAVSDAAGLVAVARDAVAEVQGDL